MLTDSFLLVIFIIEHQRLGPKKYGLLTEKKGSNFSFKTKTKPSNRKCKRIKPTPKPLGN